MPINNYQPNFNGPVYQSEGDLYINADAGVMTVTTANARRAATDLREAVAATPLPPGYGQQARGDLDQIDIGLNAGEPDRGRVAHFLDRLTRLLDAAGALVNGAASLLAPLAALAHWLGDAGRHILTLIQCG